MINKIGRPWSIITRMITDRIKRIILWHNYQSLTATRSLNRSKKTKGNSKFWFWGAWKIELIQVQEFNYGMCNSKFIVSVRPTVQPVGAIYWQGRRVSCRQIVQQRPVLFDYIGQSKQLEETSIFKLMRAQGKNSSLFDKLTGHRTKFLDKFYLRFSPPSRIVNCSPFSSPLTKFFKWATSSAFHSSSSVWWLNGSRFRRRLPENNTGSCKDKVHIKTEKS